MDEPYGYSYLHERRARRREVERRRRALRRQAALAVAGAAVILAVLGFWLYGVAASFLVGP